MIVLRHLAYPNRFGDLVDELNMLSNRINGGFNAMRRVEPRRAESRADRHYGADALAAKLAADNDLLCGAATTSLCACARRLCRAAEARCTGEPSRFDALRRFDARRLALRAGTLAAGARCAHWRAWSNVSGPAIRAWRSREKRVGGINSWPTREGVTGKAGRSHALHAERALDPVPHWTRL